MKKKIFTVLQTNEGQRLDKFLTQKNEELSRSYLQKLINSNKVLVNGQEVQNSYTLSINDEIVLTIPPARKPDLQPQDMELKVIYEDRDIIVINKEAGTIVHPVPGNYENTLVNGLLAHVDNLSGIGGVKRPGIVHRLDKNTSGVLVVAKNDKSHKNLVNQFKTRKVKKIYYTVIAGRLPYKSGKIDAPIGRDTGNRTKMAVTKKNSKRAITLFTVEEFLNGYTFLKVELKTGRTHQIRVHFSHIGHPVIGDERYGNGESILAVKRQLLHAYKLGIYHPGSGEWQEFIADMPADFKNFIEEQREKA